MIKLVIIDFDDTLTLTEEATFRLENAVAADLGFPPMPRDLHKSTWGQPVGKAITERIPGIDPDKFMLRLSELMPGYITEGKLDVIPQKNYAALDKLVAAGKQLAILTQRTQMELRHVLNPSHPLNKRIKDFKFRENSEFRKPDPRVFDYFFLKYHVQPNEVVYIGDSLTDAQCSKAAGIYFIACLENGLRQKEEFMELRVDYYVNDFAELVGAVAALDK